ncbi:peptidyl-prolyl cis-trans isomerase CYP26-2, chloroplastic [Euphorbia lathyris]|uniref:peptidyl-prolyl cis-trans isomerase CYP26-2, chloroplastic n=1 Tax=Euphorbia lathyris TaxID=212925 RepID=UPI003313C247
MLQNPKILQTSCCVKLPSPKLPPILPPQLAQCCNFSRRELTILSNSSLLLLLSSNVVEPFIPKARAEESYPDTARNDQQEENKITSPNCSNTYVTKRAFLDISIDRQPVGRIVIGVYGEAAPAGATRFSGLVSGAAGISYRRKEFIKIMPNYVQHGGVRSFGVDAELAQKTGSNLAVERLINEWERESKCAGIKNLAGTVSLIVRDPLKPPPKMKLIARGGKLEIDEEQVGTDPNGTEFVIATKDSPELDASNLVIGRVLEGMEVVERLGQVKTVQENTSSPYFKVAKLIGDKRAVVAERGFNRPYSKVTVTNCGLME